MIPIEDENYDGFTGMKLKGSTYRICMFEMVTFLNAKGLYDVIMNDLYWEWLCDEGVAKNNIHKFCLTLSNSTNSIEQGQFLSLYEARNHVLHLCGHEV